MKLSSLLTTQRIVLGLKARTLRDAISEIMNRAENFRPGQSIDVVAEAVLRRESQGSTASERGIALPHARIPGLRDFHIFLGVPGEPLEDKGLDGEPVDLVFLILCDDQKNILMLQSLAGIGKLSLDGATLEALRQGKTAGEVWRAIDASGIDVKKTLHARDLMRECPVLVREDMTLQEVLDQFFEHGVGAAPVCDAGGKVQGAVSSEEVIEAGFPDYMARIPDIRFLPEFEAFEQFFKREATTRVRDIQNRKPLVVDVEDPLIHVVFLMRQERQPFAFVEEGGRCVGYINRDDVISRILRA